MDIVTSPAQFGPNLDGMTQEELQEFLKMSRLSKKEQNEILDVNNKNAEYRDMIFWVNLKETAECINDFQNYYLYNRIFLSSDLKAKFEEMDNLMNDALEQRAIRELYGDWKAITKASEGNEEGREKSKQTAHMLPCLH